MSSAGFNPDPEKGYSSSSSGTSGFKQAKKKSRKDPEDYTGKSERGAPFGGDPSGASEKPESYKEGSPFESRGGRTRENLSPSGLFGRVGSRIKESWEEGQARRRTEREEFRKDPIRKEVRRVKKSLGRDYELTYGEVETEKGKYQFKQRPKKESSDLFGIADMFGWTDTGSTRTKRSSNPRYITYRGRRYRAEAGNGNGNGSSRRSSSYTGGLDFDAYLDSWSNVLR